MGNLGAFRPPVPRHRLVLTAAEIVPATRPTLGAISVIAPLRAAGSGTWLNIIMAMAEVTPGEDNWQRVFPLLVTIASRDSYQVPRTNAHHMPLVLDHQVAPVLPSPSGSERGHLLCAAAWSSEVYIAPFRQTWNMKRSGTTAKELWGRDAGTSRNTARP